MYRIEYNGNVIHDPSMMSSSYVLLNPKVSKEIGKVDTLDFSILPYHPYYDSFTKLQTGIVVYRDDTEIFRGRILSTTVDLFGQKEVQCEGALAYLIDSIQPKVIHDSISGENLLREIIANHNNQVEAAKRFTVGIVSATKRNETFKVNQTSYTETRQMIDSYIIDAKGGYLRVRYENGVQYLDWVESFERNPNQPIKVGTNVISYQEEVTADDFYTVLLPVGTEPAVERQTEAEIEEDTQRDHTVTISSVNNNSPYLYVSQEAVQQYGYIYHLEDYGEVSNATELLNLANETMARFRKKLNRTIEIGALDLHFVDSSNDQLLLGDVVLLSVPKFNKEERLLLTKVEYDCIDPGKDKYTFGDGLQTLTRKTESKISSVSATASKAEEEVAGESQNLFINKNLIDIKAKNMNLAVEETLKMQIDTWDIAFRELVFESESYKHTLDEQERIRNEFANEWSEVTRSMSGYVKPEEGLAKFQAISNIVGSMGRQVNTLTASLDSDGDIFSWSATKEVLQNQSEDIEEQQTMTTNIDLVLNGQDGTGGIVGSVATINETLTNAGLVVDAENNQVWMFTKDYKTGLGSYLKEESDKIEMVVGVDPNTGKKKVNAASIATAINNQTGESAVSINANKIILTADYTDHALDEYIAMLKQKIELSVTTYEDDQGVTHDALNPASIILAINGDGVSNAKINADKINLTGSTIAQRLSGTAITCTSLTTNRGVTVGGSLEAATIYITVPNGESEEGSDKVSINSGIRDIELSDPVNNVYTLTKKLYNGSEIEVGTFSRATTLTGAWDSGYFTVTASPQGNTLTTGIVSAIPNSDITWEGNTASFPIKAINHNNPEGIYIDTGRTLSIDASKRFTAGYNSARLKLDATNHIIEITNTGNLASVGIIASAFLTFDPETNKFKATSVAKANTTTMHTDDAWSDVISIAYDAAIYYSSTKSYKMPVSIKNGDEVLLSLTIPHGAIYAYKHGYNSNNTAYIEESSQTLDYGQSLTIHAKYMDYDGNTARSGKEITITAPEQSSSIDDARLVFDTDSHKISISETGSIIYAYIDCNPNGNMNLTSEDKIEMPVKIVATDNNSGTTILKEKTFTLNTTSLLKQRYTNGLNAARLDFDATNHTIKIVEKDDDHIVASAGISAVASITYDSKTHTYKATATAKADTTTMASATDTSGTEAYKAGYSDNNTAYLGDNNMNAKEDISIEPGNNYTLYACYSKYDGSKEKSGNTCIVRAKKYTEVKNASYDLTSRGTGYSNLYTQINGNMYFICYVNPQHIVYTGNNGTQTLYKK